MLARSFPLRELQTHWPGCHPSHCTSSAPWQTVDCRACGGEWCLPAVQPRHGCGLRKVRPSQPVGASVPRDAAPAVPPVSWGSGALSGACGHAKPFHLPPASIAAFWHQTCGILPGRSAWSARTPTTPPCCGTASVWRRARTPTARPAPAPMPTHVTSALAVRGVRARAGRLRNTTHASHCQETWFRRCLIPMPPLFSSCYAQHAKCCKSEHLPCSTPSTLQATAW